MSVKSCLVTETKNKLNSQNESKFNSTDVLSTTFSIILSPNPLGKISSNPQITEVNKYEN